MGLPPSIFDALEEDAREYDQEQSEIQKLKTQLLAAEEKIKKMREALEEIRNIDWGTDHCDAKNMIADKVLREIE